MQKHRRYHRDFEDYELISESDPELIARILKNSPFWTVLRGVFRTAP